jgi:ATP-dependent exoDNAse (exonuclease V) beta subunit
LYESKGLEFNDVLLYNFFENSVVDAGWRVVLNAVDAKKRGNLSVPTFNELRHLGVCSELKFLYVGLTRARNQLWIWDSSPVAEYMKVSCDFIHGIY